MTQYSPSFLKAVALVLGVEAGLSVDPNDSGNWTGGAKGKGQLLGTKWGISAAQYPQLDIPSLSRDAATAIYWRDYWIPMRGDDLPGRLASALLQDYVNEGQDSAVKNLQKALGVAPDGKVGDLTITASRIKDQDEAILDYLSYQALSYVGKTAFPRYGRGWLRRVIRTGIEVSR